MSLFGCCKENNFSEKVDALTDELWISFVDPCWPSLFRGILLNEFRHLAPDTDVGYKPGDRRGKQGSVS